MGNSPNYPSQGKVVGKPAAVFASAGGPPEKVIGILKQALGWFKLEQVVDPVGTSGGVSAEAIADCQKLGRALAEAATKK